jgi:hypothetical protein
MKGEVLTARGCPDVYGGLGWGESRNTIQKERKAQDLPR